MAARGTKRTPQRVEAALAVIRIGYSQRAAAAHIEISRSTWHAWMQDEQFAEQVRTAEDAAEGRFLAKLSTAASGDWRAAAWWLERRRPEAYGQRERVEMTVDVTATAKRVALESGLDDVEALVAEAERIASGG